MTLKKQVKARIKEEKNTSNEKLIDKIYADVDKAFARYDVDHDGNLSPDEIRDFLK